MRNLNEKELLMKQEFETSVTKGVSKSQLFKDMYDQGITVGDISKITESHYSFVYGVISSSRELEKKPTESKSDVIRKMVDEGKNPGEISKILNSNYSFVFSVVKKYKSEKEKVG